MGTVAILRQCSEKSMVGISRPVQSTQLPAQINTKGLTNTHPVSTKLLTNTHPVSCTNKHKGFNKYTPNSVDRRVGRRKVSRSAPARAARGRVGRGNMGLAGLPALYWTHYGPIWWKEKPIPSMVGPCPLSILWRGGRVILWSRERGGCGDSRWRGPYTGRGLLTRPPTDLRKEGKSAYSNPKNLPFMTLAPRTMENPLCACLMLMFPLCQRILTSNGAECGQRGVSHFGLAKIFH